MNLRDVVVGILVLLLVVGLWLGDPPPPPVPEPTPTPTPAASPTPVIQGEVGTWWEREKEKNRKAQQRR